MSDISGLWAVDKSGCWLWLGLINNMGYGSMRLPCSCGEAKRPYVAHRWVYEMFVGPIPEGLHLDHLCRVRHCVNPEHLEPVTQKENTLRGEGPTSVNAAKTHCIRGHEFAGDNLAIRKDGTRKCKACHALRSTLRRAKTDG